MAKRYQLPHPLWYYPLVTFSQELGDKLTFRQRRSGPLQLYVSVSQDLPMMEMMESWASVSENDFRAAEPFLNTFPMALQLTNPTPSADVSVPGLIETRREGCIIAASNWNILAWFVVEHLRWRDEGIAVLQYQETWYLHLPKPSIWTLEQHRGTLEEAGATIFWQWKGLPHFFWKEELRPVDAAWDRDVTVPEGIYIIADAPRVVRLPLESWRRVASISVLENFTKEERIFSTVPVISLTLEVAKSIGQRPITLLSGSDRNILVETARRFSWDELEMITCWGATDGKYYLGSTNPTASWRFLQKELDGFSSWTTHMYIPAGTRLVPALDEESLDLLFEDWQIPARALVVLEESAKGSRFVVLPLEHSHPLQELIEITTSERSIVGKLVSELGDSISAFIAEHPPVSSTGHGEDVQIHRRGAVPQEIPRSESGEVVAPVPPPQSAKAGNRGSQKKNRKSDEVPRKKQSQSSYMLDIFVNAEAMQRDAAQQQITELLSAARESEVDADVFAQISALQYALGDRVQSLVSWAEAMPLDTFPVGWNRYHLHPYWQLQKATGDFATRLAEIESRHLPAEPHYAAVALLCLDYNEENQFTTLQKQMFRDFFTGQGHPYGEIDPSTREQMIVRAEWTDESVQLWNLVAGQLADAPRAFAEIQLTQLLRVRNIETLYAWEPPELSVESEELSTLETWIETGNLSSDSARLQQWMETLRVLATFSSERDNAAQLFSYIPGEAVLDRLLSNYQGKVDQGIEGRETLFPRELNATQSIMNNKILLDLSRVFGTLKEFKRILVAMPEAVGDEPLDCADIALRLALLLMYSERTEDQATLRKQWIPELIRHLHYPDSVIARQGWLFVLMLIWQAPDKEKRKYFEVLGEKLASLRIASGTIEDWALIVTVMQGSVLYSSAARESIVSIGELQRRSRWVQCARHLLNRSFSELVAQWKEEVKK